MIADAVSVPGEPNGAPVNDSMAVPIEIWPPGGSGIDAGVSPAAVFGHLLGSSFDGACWNRKVIGQLFGRCLRVVVARKNIHDDVGGFKSNGKALWAAAGMPGA